MRRSGIKASYMESAETTKESSMMRSFSISWGAICCAKTLPVIKSKKINTVKILPIGTKATFLFIMVIFDHLKPKHFFVKNTISVYNYVFTVKAIIFGV